MAEEVARLVAVMEANLKGFQKGMDQAQKLADRRFGQIEKRLQQSENRFSGAFKRLGNLVIGGGALIGIQRFVSHVAQMAGNLQDTSDALGVSTDALQTWGILAGRAGVGQEQFNKALGIFSQRLGDAQLKGGAFAKFLTGIGVGTGGSTEDVFFRLADAIRDTADQQQRAAIVAEAFGAKAVKLVPILQQGSAALKAQGIEFSKNGQIMTREAIAKIDDLGDKWEDLKRQFTAVGGNVLAGFADSFSQFAAELSSPEFQKSLQEFGRIMGQVAAFAAKLAPILPNLLGAAAGARVGRIGGTPGAIGGAVIGGLVPELLQTQARSVDELERALARLKATLDSLPPADVGRARERITELEAEIAKARMVVAPAAAVTGTGAGGTINRTGTLGAGDTARSLTEALNFGPAIAELGKDLQEQISADLRESFELAFQSRELREQSKVWMQEIKDEELQAIEDFHTEAEAAWDDYWQRQADAAQETSDIIADEVGRGLIDIGLAARHGFGAAEDAARRFLDRLVDLSLQMFVLEPLLKFLGGLGLGDGKFISRLISGRASGGRVNPGQPYVVGERRPELFVPDTAGTIIPRIPNVSAVSSGGPAITQSFQIDARGAQMGVADQIEARMRALAPQIVAASVRTVQRNFAPMMVKAQRDSL